MKILYKQGDLLEASERVIISGCNAQGVMRSGLAKSIREKYPEVFDEYRNVYEYQGNVLHLGQNIWVTCSDGFTVINAITQEFYGRNPGVLYASYDGLRKSLKEINEDVLTKNIHAIGFPLICCGLANGDWKIVSSIIEEESNNFQPVVYRL